MKKILLTIVLIFGVMFILNTGADALTYPDPMHEPLGPDDVPGIFEGSAMVSNPFFIPTGGMTITFDYNLITNEFDDEEPDVNDYFGVALIDPVTQSILTLSTVADIYTSDFTPISGGTTGPHGSTFAYETGVLSGSFVIGSEYENTSAMLAFGVFDIEDPVVDTGVLIDNVSLPYGDFENGLIGEIVAPSVFENVPGGMGFIYDEGEGSYMYSGNVHLLPDGSLTGVDTDGFSSYYAYMSTGPEDMPPVVPEPISSALFLIGGAILGIRGFRKKA